MADKNVRGRVGDETVVDEVMIVMGLLMLLMLLAAAAAAAAAAAGTSCPASLSRPLSSNERKQQNSNA
jgi:hypothetical protein